MAHGCGSSVSGYRLKESILTDMWSLQQQKHSKFDCDIEFTGNGSIGCCCSRWKSRVRKCDSCKSLENGWGPAVNNVMLWCIFHRDLAFSLSTKGLVTGWSAGCSFLW